MTKSREQLAERAMKKRDRITNKWRKKALRVAKRELKRQTSNGEIVVWVWVDLNGVDPLHLPWAWMGVRESVPIIESMGFVVTRHQRYVTATGGEQYRIEIDLLREPSIETKEEVK